MAQAPIILDATRLLYYLQQVNEIAQQISGQTDTTEITRQVTEALVSRFDCVFARVWLVEPDQMALRLVASSGLYTRLDGSFARVPIGAYKVGKIAQNRVPFLSNNLPEESWVKDRDWAIANQIRGFAGYPLTARDRVLGVLATFSQLAFAPEFLEALRMLCMTVTIAVDAAAPGQKLRAHAQLDATLSDQIAAILPETQLTLIGTEQTVSRGIAYAFLQAAELLGQYHCRYCRLLYQPSTVVMEAIVPMYPQAQVSQQFSDRLAELRTLTYCLGGTLQTQSIMTGKAYQFFLEMPYPAQETGPIVQVRCRQPLIQQAIAHLASRAGLTVGGPEVEGALLLTDQESSLNLGPCIWVHQGRELIPTEVVGCIDLSTTPGQLRELVLQVNHGEVNPSGESVPSLSDREQQVMRLLAEGMRDREIAQQLFISESTVKFHINNTLTKLKAKNRYQGVYQATIRGWI